MHSSVLNWLGAVLGFLMHLTLRKWQREEDEAIGLIIPTSFIWDTALSMSGVWAILPFLHFPTTLLDNEHSVSGKYTPQIDFIKIAVVLAAVCIGVFGACRCTLKSAVSGLRNWLWAPHLLLCSFCTSAVGENTAQPNASWKDDTGNALRNWSLPPIYLLWEEGTELYSQCSFVK